MSGKYTRSILIMATASLHLVSCATSETRPDAQQAYKIDAKDEVVCRRQRTFGSYVTKLVCRTRAEIEADRTAALEMTGPLRTMGGDEPRRPPE